MLRDNLGLLLMKKTQFKKAEEVFDKLLVDDKKRADKFNEATSYTRLAAAQFAQLDQKKLGEAVKRQEDGVKCFNDANKLDASEKIKTALFEAEARLIELKVAKSCWQENLITGPCTSKASWGPPIRRTGSSKLPRGPISCSSKTGRAINWMSKGWRIKPTRGRFFPFTFALKTAKARPLAKAASHLAIGQKSRSRWLETSGRAVRTSRTMAAWLQIPKGRQSFPDKDGTNEGTYTQNGKSVLLKFHADTVLYVGEISENVLSGQGSIPAKNRNGISKSSPNSAISLRAPPLILQNRGRVPECSWRGLSALCRPSKGFSV